MASTEGEEKNTRRNTARFVRTTAAATHAPSKFGLMTENMRSTAAGVYDKATGQWAARLDNAHRGINTPHININKAMSGVKDPHIPVSSEVLTAGKAATKTIHVVAKGALIAGIVIDTYRITNAVVDDCKNTKKKRPGKKTAKVASSVGGTWAGGFAGAWAGNSTGAAVGGAIGALFGGVGAVPGAIVGSAIGSVCGAITGGVAGSAIAENLVEELVSDDEYEDDEN